MRRSSHAKVDFCINFLAASALGKVTHVYCRFLTPYEDAIIFRPDLFNIVLCEPHTSQMQTSPYVETASLSLCLPSGQRQGTHALWSHDAET